MRAIARLAGVVVAAVAALTQPASPASGGGATLAAVQARGFVRCGVGAEPVPGFAVREADGRWGGFDVDYCRAVAAAVLGDDTAVRFVVVDEAAPLAAVRDGGVDLLARALPWPLSRDAGAGVDFAALTFFDGQGFMVPRALGVRSALELDGVRVCVRDGAALDHLRGFFERHLMEQVVLLFRDFDTLFAAYAAGLCDAATADLSRLEPARQGLDEPDAHRVLPELVARKPRALAVAAGDPGWADVVRWVHMALLAAEERGWTRARAGAEGRDVLVSEGGRRDDDARLAAALGLTPGWARRAVAAVGHYGELFERHLGVDSPRGMRRGANALWRAGGLHYPLPLR